MTHHPALGPTSLSWANSSESHWRNERVNRTTCRLLGKTSGTPHTGAGLSVARGLLCRGCLVHGPCTCTTTDKPQHPSQVPSWEPRSATPRVPLLDLGGAYPARGSAAPFGNTPSTAPPPHRRRDQPCPEQTRDTVLVRLAMVPSPQVAS